MSYSDPDEMELLVSNEPPPEVLGAVLIALYSLPTYKVSVKYDADSECLVIKVRRG